MAAPMARPANARLLTRMPDAVLVEWENVLVETSRARRDALVRAFANEGLRLDEITWFAGCQGRPLRDAVASALASSNTSDATLADLLVLRASRSFAEWLSQGFLLAPGARDFIEQAQAGTRIGIVTSATYAETEFVLRLAGLESAVSTVVSADGADSMRASYERALSQLARGRPARGTCSVAIAHAPLALRGARAAGVRTVAIGALAHDALEADGAVATLDGLSLAELARMAGIGAREHQP